MFYVGIQQTTMRISNQVDSVVELVNALFSNSKDVSLNLVEG
jgi:hypothetical protein